MKKLIPTIALIVSSILITSCGNSPTDTVKETTTNTIETTQIESQLEDSRVSSNETKLSPVNNISKSPKTEVVSTTPRNPQTQPIANKQPQVGTVKELVTGDIICYATIVDEQGKEHRVGASFEICAESEKYLNKKVRASYQIASLNDCESIEPCGKSRQESIISQMQILGESATKPQAKTQPIANNQPQVGTVKELVTGDIICYATIVDEQGKEHRVGASFEICAESEKYLNKKVRASYKIASLNDCESIEPCGKSRQESIISQMEILGESATKPQASNSSTFSNGRWTITIGNRNSWSGVNNTGNLTYKGCDAKGNCIELTGGKVSCRRGECVMGWVNGDYRYIWSQVITEDGNGPSTLIVKQRDKEILNATGFKLVNSR